MIELKNNLFNLFIGHFLEFMEENSNNIKCRNIYEAFQTNDLSKIEINSQNTKNELNEVFEEEKLKN
jgi:hypothetical protein